MNDRKETRVCANEGCGKAPEEGSRFCASCGLEWMLLRRDTRAEPRAGDKMPRS